MISETKIIKFLEVCNSDDKSHVRLFKMLFKSAADESDFLEILNQLIINNVNVTNLEQMKKTIELIIPINSNQMKRVVSCKTGFGRRESFKRYLNYNESASPTLIDSSKRMKIEESGEFGIPGLEDNGETLKSMTVNGIVDELNNMKTNQSNLDQRNINHSNLDQQVPSALKLNDNKNQVFLNNNVLVDLNYKDLSYLYMPLQCKLCGLRYREDMTEEFGVHIEDHRRKTKALGDKAILRREYFNMADDRGEKIDLKVIGGSEPLIWEKDAPVCIICEKIIKKSWNDDVENWTLDDGAKINAKDVAHKMCVI